MALSTIRAQRRLEVVVYVLAVATLKTLVVAAVQAERQPAYHRQRAHQQTSPENLGAACFAYLQHFYSLMAVGAGLHFGGDEAEGIVEVCLCELSRVLGT